MIYFYMFSRSGFILHQHSKLEINFLKEHLHDFIEDGYFTYIYIYMNINWTKPIVLCSRFTGSVMRFFKAPECDLIDCLGSSIKNEMRQLIC